MQALTYCDFSCLLGYQLSYIVTDTVVAFIDGSLHHGIVTQQSVTLDKVTIAYSGGEREVLISHVRPGNARVIAEWLGLIRTNLVVAMHRDEAPEYRAVMIVDAPERMPA